MQAYRREVKHDFPVVESDSKWSMEGEIGPHIIIRFTILNRLDETLVIQECTIKKPRRATISNGIISSSGMLVPSRGIGQRIILNYNVYRSQAFSFALFLSPPEDWRPGEIVARFLISSKASTIRSKRIVTRSVIAAAPHMQTDAKASKYG